MGIYSLMRKFTIQTRMLAAIAVVLMLVATLGGAGMLGMFRIHGMSDEFMSGSFPAVNELATMRSEMGLVRQHEKDMIIQYERPDAVNAAYAKWLASLKNARAAGNRLLALSSETETAQLGQVSRHLNQYEDQFAHVAKQLQNSGYDTATVANRTSAKAVQEFDQANRILGLVEKQLKKYVTQVVQDQNDLFKQTQWLFLLVAAVTVLVVVPLTVLNMYSICKPLLAAKKMAEAIARGDLSQVAQVQGEDEVADLERALSDMRQGLGVMVAQVNDASSNIAIASQEISTGNHDLSHRTEQTASNVQETVAAITQLMATVQQTSASSSQANRLAMSASGIAERGGNVVQQAVASMHEISSSSRKINDIIGLIDSIAFQTNILALNAAVEAARAGEQGRGFAVVAGEVRSLAQRSAAAASEIKALIKNSVTVVDGGVRHVEDAGSAMLEIVASVQRVVDIMAEISAAAAEQSMGIGQVNSAVNDIDRMTQQNAALVEESAAAADSLHEQAGRMSEVVRQFRLESSLNNQGKSALGLPGRASQAGTRDQKRLLPA